MDITGKIKVQMIHREKSQIGERNHGENKQDGRKITTKKGMKKYVFTVYSNKRILQPQNFPDLH